MASTLCQKETKVEVIHTNINLKWIRKCDPKTKMNKENKLTKRRHQVKDFAYFNCHICQEVVVFLVELCVSAWKRRRMGKKKGLCNL